MLRMSEDDGTMNSDGGKKRSSNANARRRRQKRGLKRKDCADEKPTTPV
jgi:hypothetical protein